MKEQYQLCLRWPGRGFALDAIRLASLEEEEWDALRGFVRANASVFPVASAALSGSAPYYIGPEYVSDIARECAAAVVPEDLALVKSAMQTFSWFLSQAQAQSEASIYIGIWPGERYETQVYIQPGTDLLADLELINQEMSRSSEV